MNGKPKAVTLLSGGLDSTTTAAIALADGYDVYAMTFNYGQRHDVEIQAAQRIGQKLGVVEHIVTEIDMRPFKGSALTSELAVPKGRSVEEMGEGIPVTYVPARNTIFLSFAMAWAEVLGASDIFIGVNAVDYSGYPDCRPEFIAAFQSMGELATKAGVEGTSLKIHTPLIDLTKREIAELAVSLGVDINSTHSCYDPVNESPCGECDSCLIRDKAIKELTQ